MKNFSGTIFTQCPNPFKLSSHRLSGQFYISNFLNFSFSPFLINFPLSNGQRVEYRPFFYFSPFLPSTLVKFQIRCCPTQFSNVISSHTTWCAPVRQVGGKGCRNDCNSFQLEYHVPSGCRGNSLLFVTNTGDKIVQGWRLRWKYRSIVILRFFVKLTPSPPPLHICVQNIAKFITYIERIMIVNGNSNYDRWLVRCCVSLHT